MRTLWIFLLTIACAATATAQSSQSSKPPKTISLNGCVQRDEKKPDGFVLTDPKAKKTYRLTGTDLREYVGRLVQVDGGLVIKGVRIAGGLQPNPNIAAQAGALDPSRAAVQAATANGAPRPDTDTEEFRVKTIRSTGGTCQ